MTDNITTSDATLHGWYGKVGVLLAILVVAPIWLVEYPPLVDYPNHLARGYILYHHDDVPTFAEHFDIVYRPIPSLATDLFLVALQPIFDVRTAGKIFLTLTLWLYLTGWHLLGCAIHGKPTWLALGGALVAYHSMFLWGFTNFSFGLGMFLVATAAWLQWRANWTSWRLIFMAILALGCYLSHLSAFVFLAGTALALTFWDLWQGRKFSAALIVGLVPALLPLGFFAASERSGGSEIVWSTLMNKFVGALCLFRGYDRHVDAGFLVAVAVFLILLGVWASSKRCNSGALFAGLGCVAMFLIAPQVIFGGSPADARFLPPAAALVTLSLDLSFPRRRAIVLLGLFLMLVIFRLGAIALTWHAFNADLRDQAALFAEFPDQAKVYPMVHVSDQPEEQKLGLASFHMIHYAVIDRHIYSPHLFQYPGQQPIRYKSPPIDYHRRQFDFPADASVNWDKVFTNHDHLWCWRLPESQRELLQNRCTLVAERGNGTIWRITKASRNP